MSDGIVCFAGQDWYIHGRAHCDFQVMRELAGDDRVLVVNSIGMRVPIPGRTEAPARRIVRKLRSILRHYVARPLPAVPNLVLMSPVAVPAFITRAARRLNGAVVAAQVRAAAAAHRVRDPWVVVAVPTAIDAIELAGWSDRVIYYRADDNAAQPDVDHQLIRAFEDRVIAAAHLVLYSSATLLERERERVGDKGVFFDHGVEVDHFHAADRTEPTDVAAIARPRIGFVGAIDQQSVDLDLIDRLGARLHGLLRRGDQPQAGHGVGKRREPDQAQGIPGNGASGRVERLRRRRPVRGRGGARRRPRRVRRRGARSARRRRPRIGRRAPRVGAGRRVEPAR